jgi:L-lactate dehydrogenase complex protein LldG
MSARDEVLARIRTALGNGRTSPVEDLTSPENSARSTGGARPAGNIRTTGNANSTGNVRPTGNASAADEPDPATHADRYGYRARTDLDPIDLLDRLADRLIDYKCSVRRCGPTELTETLAAAIAERGARRLVLPPDLDLPLPDPHVVTPGSEWVVDDGSLTTYALDSFDGVITTATVAVAETGTIILDGSPGQGRRALTLIPDYHLCVLYRHQIVGLVPEAVALLNPSAPLTWISGPSATSDIELDRVEGVHGPRTLEVILVNNR